MSKLSYKITYLYLKRCSHYLGTMIKYATPTKIWNLLVVEIERLSGQTILSGKPYFLIVEPTNICQLKCPLCATGRGYITRKKGQMSFLHFKQIIDELSKFTFHVFFYNWGEPLLHPQLPEFIAYAHQKKVATIISSNLSLELLEDKIEAIITSGLDKLVVSMDGVDQESYSRYRRGGKFKLVVENIKKFIRIKKKLKMTTPYIEWQYLLMRHNEMRVNEAEQLAKELGVDALTFGEIILPHGFSDETLIKEWFPTSKVSFKRADKLQGWGKKCWLLWRMGVINYDGEVSPCCYIYEDKGDFGNIKDDGFIKVWNNSIYQSARKAVTNRNGKKITTVCDYCSMVKNK